MDEDRRANGLDVVDEVEERSGIHGRAVGRVTALAVEVRERRLRGECCCGALLDEEAAEESPCTRSGLDADLCEGLLMITGAEESLSAMSWSFCDRLRADRRGDDWAVTAAELGGEGGKSKRWCSGEVTASETGPISRAAGDKFQC